MTNQTYQNNLLFSLNEGELTIPIIPARKTKSLKKKPIATVITNTQGIFHFGPPIPKYTGNLPLTDHEVNELYNDKSGDYHTLYVS
jgi:hypothetical protein